MLRLFHQQAEDKAKILNIYHYLYKFSLERLQKMLRQKEMALLVAYYFSQNKYERIHSSPSMNKHKKAYYEASSVILRQFF